MEGLRGENGRVKEGRTEERRWENGGGMDEEGGKKGRGRRGRRGKNGGKMEDDGGSYRMQLIRGFALTVFMR